MALPYNPIVRTFNQLRAVLVDTLGVDRGLVCPATPLELLIPAERRREVLDRLREAGFRAPERDRLVVEHPLFNLVLVGVTVALIPAMLQALVAFCVILPLALVLVVIGCRVTRERVVQGPLGPRTVGEMVIYLTRFSEHQGYRFSRNEIALKVRFLVAEWLGVPVDQVREDSNFINLSI